MAGGRRRSSASYVTRLPGTVEFVEALASLIDATEGGDPLAKLLLMVSARGASTVARITSRWATLIVHRIRAVLMEPRKDLLRALWIVMLAAGGLDGAALRREFRALARGWEASSSPRARAEASAKLVAWYARRIVVFGRALRRPVFAAAGSR